MDLEAQIKAVAPSFSKAIEQAAQSSHNEAEFRSKVSKFIEDFATKASLTMPVREEYTLINGRADAVYNRLIIEYEPPHSIRQSNSFKVNQHAIGQVKKYMEGIARKERHKPERLAGVVLDGSFFIYIRNKEGLYHIDNPIKVDMSSTEWFLRLLCSLSTELALIPENLVRDFGENTIISRKCVSTLYETFKSNKNPKVKTLFEQWSLQFSEVCDYEESSKLNVKSFARDFGIKDGNPKPFDLFFCIHTYYATFIKLLALQIVHYYTMPKLGTDLRKAATFSDSELRSYMKKVEEGGIFKDLGFTNLLEADFFGWYEEIWDEEIYKAIKELIAQLANYSLVTLDVDPSETQDLLKKLYQNLMPKPLRHNLGEYYTPDWLAERLLGMLCGWRRMDDIRVPDIRPNYRILDPACGSGTFLVLCIKHIRDYAKNQMLTETQVLEKILDNIVGFDLNPLAVISARTNYLLALGDLIQHRKENIDIPVYICDSIMTPHEGEDLFGKGTMRFNTAVGSFSLPKSLVYAKYIDKLANFLEETVKLKLNKEQFILKLTSEFPLDPKKDMHDIEEVLGLYEKLNSLDKQKINGIWARIIKNAFAPLFAGEFDYIAGNPPWVNWDSLPQGYRSETKPLWLEYGLFPHSGMDTILGKGEKDISMIMTYVAIDKYLKQNGKLGFVITQSIFKTGAGQGFRKFILANKNLPIQVVHVDDMVKLNPFEGASNRTSVVILQKGKQTQYPMPSYLYWIKTVRGKSIAFTSELQDVLKMTERKQFVAEPVSEDDLTSPWITLRPKALKAIRKIIGQSDYRAYMGAYSTPNAVFWVEIIDSRPDRLVLIANNISKRAKKKIEGIQTVVEPDLLYPLLLGRDVKKWNAKPSAHILITQDPSQKRGIDENVMKEQYPKTYIYLKRYEKTLKERGIFRRYFTRKEKDGSVVEIAPFYSMFNVGHYTFAPYKVVWKYIATDFICSVIGSVENKPIIPNDKLVLIDCSDKKEAYYLCGMCNSSPSRLIVISYGIETQLAPHLVKNIHIPKYDPKNKLHHRLAELSEKAHEEIDKQHDVSAIETEIDKLAAEIWGLTKEELKEIKTFLEE